MASAPELLADLARAFPRERLQAETVRIYVAHLSDIPVDVLAAAVTELIRTSDYFPTVKAIRERCAERTLSLPTEAEALAQIEDRLHHSRVGGETPPAMHPLVASAIRHLGGLSAFRSTDAPAVLRGQFLRLYREARAGALRDVMVGELRPALEAGPRLREIG